MGNLKDYTLIDVLHDILTEMRSMNSRLTEIEKKLSSVATKSSEYKSVLNLSEAAEYLSISKSNLYKMTSTMRIPYTKPSGKRIYFERKKLDDWLLLNPQKTRYEIDEEARQLILKSGRRKY